MDLNYESKVKIRGRAIIDIDGIKGTYVIPNGITVFDCAVIDKKTKCMVFPEGVFYINPSVFGRVEFEKLEDIYLPNSLDVTKINILHPKKEKRIHIKEEGKIADFFREQGYAVEIEDWTNKFEFLNYTPNFQNDFRIKDGTLYGYPKFDKVLKIPEGVTSIEGRLFEGFDNLLEVILPESIETIDKYAFSHCRNLRKINFPSNLKKIDYAFLDTGFKEINLPSTIKSAWCSFIYCSNLESAVISNGEGLNRDGTFSSCENLTKVLVEEGEELYNSFSRTAISTFEFPKSIKTIGSLAFSGCKNIENLIIPDTVNKIDYYAFSDCSGLKSITIPDSVTKIKYSAFKDCTNLLEIKIPHKVKKIEEETFKNCKNLKRVELPEGLEVLEKAAFTGCNSLEEIRIPASLKEFGEIEKSKTSDELEWVNCPFASVKDNNNIYTVNDIFQNYTIIVPKNHPIIECLKYTKLKYIEK